MSEYEPAPREERPPWPYLTIKAAARMLSVDRELIEGLAGGKTIRSFSMTGKTGLPRRVVNREDVKALRGRVRDMA